MAMERILDRNAKCPLCSKYYHRWDAYMNPIPTRKHQRTEEELCKCAKGENAREWRRMRRMEIMAEQERRKQRRDEILSMQERNANYWKEVNG